MPISGIVYGGPGGLPPTTPSLVQGLLAALPTVQSQALTEDFAPARSVAEVLSSLSTWADTAAAVVSTSHQVYAQLGKFTFAKSALTKRQAEILQAKTLKGILDEADVRMKKRAGNTQALRLALSKLGVGAIPAELLLEALRQAASYATVSLYVRGVFTQAGQAVEATKKAETAAQVADLKKTVAIAADAAAAAVNDALSTVGSAIPWWIWGIAGVAGLGILYPYVSPFLSRRRAA